MKQRALKNQTPEHLADVKKAAMGAAESALRWFVYQQWHPDSGTINFERAYRDFKAGIPVEDVLFARGIKVTGDTYQMKVTGHRYG